MAAELLISSLCLESNLGVEYGEKCIQLANIIHRCVILLYDEVFDKADLATRETLGQSPSSHPTPTHHHIQF